MYESRLCVFSIRPSIYLIEPLDYLPFVYLMNRAYLVLTDSGGIQEEASSLGKPVLVMRQTTERPEGVKAGTVKLVGTDTLRIVSEVTALLDDAAQYHRMSTISNPYGDGHAAEYRSSHCEPPMSGTLFNARARLAHSPLARRFLGGAAWSILGAVVSSGITLGMLMLLARVLGRETYGQFVVIQGTLGMAGVFAGFGIGTAATRYAAELRMRDMTDLVTYLPWPGGPFWVLGWLPRRGSCSPPDG